MDEFIYAQEDVKSELLAHSLNLLNKFSIISGLVIDEIRVDLREDLFKDSQDTCDRMITLLQMLADLLY